MSKFSVSLVVSVTSAASFLVVGFPRIVSVSASLALSAGMRKRQFQYSAMIAQVIIPCLLPLEKTLLESDIISYSCSYSGCTSEHQQL